MITITYKHLVYSLLGIIVISLVISLYYINSELREYKLSTNTFRLESSARVNQLEDDLAILTNSFRQFLALSKNYPEEKVHISDNKKLDIKEIEESISASKTVIIKTEKANLRLSPNEKSEVVVTLSKGTELIVTSEIEGWSRVLTPTGNLAWVSNTVLIDAKNIIG